MLNFGKVSSGKGSSSATSRGAAKGGVSYNWGNHNNLGYLKTETDPVFAAWLAGNPLSPYALTSSLGTMAFQAKIAVDIDGGDIDGTTIGATSAASGRFTSVINTSGTPGHVLYYGASGVHAGSANFTWTNASNKLFIGGNISVTVNSEPTTRKAFLLIGRETTNRHGGIIGGGTVYTVDTLETKFLFNSESGYKNPGIVGVSDNNLDIPSINNFGSAGVLGIAGGATSGRHHAGVYGHGYLSSVLGGASNNFAYGGYFTSRITSAVTDFNGSIYGSFNKADISAGLATGGFVYGSYNQAVGKTNATTYGGYFTASGGTTNWGLYVNAGDSYFSGNSGFGTNTNLTAWGVFGAGTTAKASLRILTGVAPTSPNNGDIWQDGTNIYIRIGGVTKTFTLV